MHSLIVVSHPDPASLTHAVATGIGRAITAASTANSVEIADLAREGFDPRFTLDDIGVINRTAPASGAVRTEQARIDSADRLIITYPVYWWSMPALLKGWIDRVFASGWAYDESPDGKLEKRLGRLHVHLVAIGGATRATYDRRGYSKAMAAQIDHGIFDYCGAQLLSSDLLLIPETRTTDELLAEACRIGRRIAGGDTGRAAA
ncbi:MAG: NAD(P)H-dependent oxidoreductase [Sphingopyxis sp.]|nr:NAD(P)H-dependent oxidoreductase [Sphingopyxis sp.]